MDLYVIRRPSAWANVQELEAAGTKSAKVGNDQMSDRVRWIRSYVVKEPMADSARSASTRRGILNRSASTQGGSACRVIRFPCGQDHLRPQRSGGSERRCLRKELNDAYFAFRYKSPEHWVELFRGYYGPVLKAFAAIDPPAREALEADLYALLGEFNIANDGTLVAPSEYLEIVITKNR